MMTSVYPDFGAIGGAAAIRDVVGALMMIVLIAAVLMLIVSAVGWALGAAGGNYRLAARARIGVGVSCGAVALAGAAVAWFNFLLGVGGGI